MADPCYIADWSGTPPYITHGHGDEVLWITDILPSSGPGLNDTTVAVPSPVPDIIVATWTISDHPSGGDYGIGPLAVMVFFDAVGNTMGGFAITQAFEAAYPTSVETTYLAYAFELSDLAYWGLFVETDVPDGGSTTLHLDFFCTTLTTAGHGSLGFTSFTSASQSTRVARSRSFVQVI